MARFVPDVASADIEHDSERIVYDALRDLPDGYVVLHSFPWLRPMRDLKGTPLNEGEADFVVLHPARGMLVVEVKGGEPYLRDRRWFRGNNEMKDPFEQARRNRHALLDAVQERTRGRLRRGMFTHGDVVIFPHHRWDGELPHNADPRIVLDARDISKLAAKIEEAFSAWARPQTPLTARQFAELLDALMPKLRLLRCVGAEIAAEGRRIIQITEDQRATLAGLLDNDRVLVQGTAGSGKTLLALEFAVETAARGSPVLLLCFNTALASWLQEQVRADPRLQKRPGALEISNFHSFALRLAGRARVQFEVPNEGGQAFWDDEVSLILEQALDVMRSEGRAPTYDAVVVDEAQDFAPDWWVTVESLARRGREGRLYAFLDLHQSLRGETALPPVAFPTRFSLRTNCRNTKEIASSAAVIVSTEAKLLPGTPRGEAPSVRRAPTAAAQAGLVLEELRRLLRDGIAARQIAVIGPASYEKGALARFEGVEGVPFVTDAAEWRAGAGVLVSTARSFKGLEADLVIVYDLSRFTDLFTRADLYVAWTRAKHRLICVCHGAEARARIEAALAEAKSRSSRLEEAPPGAHR